MKIHIDYTLLDLAKQENKITFFHYNFIKSALNGDRLKKAGLSKKQSEVLKDIMPKLYDGTIYYVEEVDTEIETQHQNTEYSYSYTYDEEITDHTPDTTSKIYQSKDLLALFPNLDRKDQ